MKQLLLSLALIALTACAAAPPAPTLTRDTPGNSSGDIGDWLESPNQDVRDHALDMVRADPGAYLPTTFAWVANELHRRGETAEAAKWSEFGGQRLSLDIAFMTPSANDDQRAFLAMLPGRYADDLGDDFLNAYLALPPAQLRANFEEVQRLQASAPRRYAANWALDAGHAYATNWVSNPAEWLAQDQQRLDALYTENLPTFQRTLQLVIDMQASH
ncbi:MAG: hypothetical protein KA153_06635 [Hyphomonadaceae bacterium]|nr:hypothetical protein [Hyphomonadaceae bacterium]